jgi:hypothetical protein
VSRLRIRRAPWVPYCHRGCCWSSGAPLPASQVALVTNFPDFVAFRTRSPAHDREFRDAVRRCMRLPAGAPAARDPAEDRVITWVLASSYTTGRRVHEEGQLVSRLSRALPKGWSLRTMNLSNTTYIDEVRQIASSDVLVALFGSSLHNARVMAPNTTVVELHGALQRDFDQATDWMYCRLARRLGLHWAGFAPDGFRPIGVDTSVKREGWAYRKIHGRSTAHWAVIDADRFVSFFQRVLVAHLSRNFSELTLEYKLKVKANPDPRKTRHRNSKDEPLR